MPVITNKDDVTAELNRLKAQAIHRSGRCYLTVKNGKPIVVREVQVRHPDHPGAKIYQRCLVITPLAAADVSHDRKRALMSAWSEWHSWHKLSKAAIS
jgi:hypothetical protein